MIKRNAYQVKFTIHRKGFKSFTSAGIVLTTSQAKAVKEATQTMMETVKHIDNVMSVKLHSASKLTTYFFLMPQDDIEEIAKEKSVLERVTEMHNPEVK